VKLLAVVVAVEVAVVAGVGFDSRSGLPGLAAGLVLAPLAVGATHRLGLTLDGPTFALGTASAYVLIPLVALAYFLPPYRTVYRNDVLPTLLGLERPALLTLGVGAVLVASLAPARVVGAAGAVAAIAGVAIWGVGGLGDVKTALHETGWSVALAGVLPFVGVIGASRRSPWLGLGLAGWFAAVLLRATHSSFDDGAFWRELAPALPTLAVLAASIALLVPRIRPAPARAPVDAP